jgi:hypothetical protein
MSYQTKKLFSLLGMIALFAFAAINVISSEVHEVKQALPGSLNNLAEVKTLEIKDADGRLILSGHFGSPKPSSDELERQTVLTATDVMPKAKGVAEIEISNTRASFTEQELELSVKQLSAGAEFYLFIDGQEVASFTTNHQGKAELEFTNKPLQSALRK